MKWQNRISYRFSNCVTKSKHYRRTWIQCKKGTLIQNWSSGKSSSWTYHNCELLRNVTMHLTPWKILSSLCQTRLWTSRSFFAFSCNTGRRLTLSPWICHISKASSITEPNKLELEQKINNEKKLLALLIKISLHAAASLDDAQLQQQNNESINFHYYGPH